MNKVYLGEEMRKFYIFISMETPAGRSRLPRESTVRGEGSRISIKRLWTKTSKCSWAFFIPRDVEGTTEINVLLVGRGMGPIIFAPEAKAVSIIFPAASSMTL